MQLAQDISIVLAQRSWALGRQQANTLRRATGKRPLHLAILILLLQRNYSARGRATQQKRDKLSRTHPHEPPEALQLSLSFPSRRHCKYTQDLSQYTIMHTTCRAVFYKVYCLAR